jgi:hypothetical protein
VHEHPQPPLPPFDASMYGEPGTSDSAPVAVLLGAATADCGECYRAQLAVVAADPLLSTHLAACAYLALKAGAERAGEPVPPVAELAKVYVSTLAAMFAAFGLDAFEHALMFAKTAEPAKGLLMVEQAAGLVVDAMVSGEPTG